MENTPNTTDTGAGAGPATDTKAATPNMESPSSQPAPGKLNTREALRARLAQKEAAEARQARAAKPAQKDDNTESAQVAPEADEVGDKTQEATAKPSRAEKRIEKLTQRYYAAEKRAAQSAAENARLVAAVKMMQEDIARLQSKAADRIDPAEEARIDAARAKEVERILADKELDPDAMYERSTGEWQTAQAVDDLIEEVNGLAGEYYLTSAEEILLKMRSTGMTATEAARQLHGQRAARAAKSAAPAHPRSVGISGTGSTDAVRKPHSTQTAREFFARRLAEKNGRAE